MNRQNVGKYLVSNVLLFFVVSVSARYMILIKRFLSALQANRQTIPQTHFYVS